MYRTGIHSDIDAQRERQEGKSGSQTHVWLTWGGDAGGESH